MRIFSLCYLPICNKIILSYFMALFTHLTFLLNLPGTFERWIKINFLQTAYISSKPHTGQTIHLPLICDDFLPSVGFDMSFSLLLFVPSILPISITPFLTYCTFTCCRSSLLPLSTSSREQRPTFQCSVPRAIARQGVPCMTGGWTD